jgi:hypothetical protein
MTQFIEEIGSGYMNEMLIGAPFLYKGDVYLFDGIERTTSKNVSTYKLGPDVDNLIATPAQVPAAIFTGWKSFAFPTLGYRMAADGQVLCYLSRNNSVRRGLNPRDIGALFHDVSYECQRRFGTPRLNIYNDNNHKAYMAFKPTFLAFTDGLAQVMAGKIPAFAISADFAVAPSDRVNFLEILFRQRPVGSIDEDGNIKLTVESVLPSWNSTNNGELTNE